ncbi:unnamed protein product [Closterium sp. Naga37s-1]|nr:unnamed protein product [Closterium sp. Naga37s-1]
MLSPRAISLFVMMVVSYEEASTCYHNFFTFARQRFADNPCLGTRTGDGFSWESYELTARRASDFGAGLVYLGLKPGDRFGIYSVNNAEWVLAELGGYCYGLVNVSLYATLGQEAVNHVVNHSEMVAVVCSVETLSSLYKALPSAPAVKTVIYMQGGGQAPSDADRQAAEDAGVKLIPFSQVEEWGAQNPQEHTPPKPEDLAVLMYTSGTTVSGNGTTVSGNGTTVSGNGTTVSGDGTTVSGNGTTVVRGMFFIAIPFIAAPSQERGRAKEYVLDELVKRAKATSMKGFEVVRGVTLEAEAFTTDNDLMTPSFKLKRPKLKSFTTDNDLMTPSFKLKRPKLKVGASWALRLVLPFETRSCWVKGMHGSKVAFSTENDLITPPFNLKRPKLKVGAAEM